MPATAQAMSTKSEASPVAAKAAEVLVELAAEAVEVAVDAVEVAVVEFVELRLGAKTSKVLAATSGACIAWAKASILKSSRFVTLLRFSGRA